MIKKQRIKSALKKRFPQLSLKHIKELLENKQVKLNGKVASFHALVDESDELELPMSETASCLVPNPELSCHLVRKTPDYIILEKPVGLHSVAHQFKECETVANWLLSVDEDLALVSTPLESGLVHRLDKETSGIMVAARNKKAFEHLKQEFQNKSVFKEYLCVTAEKPPEPGKYLAFATNKNKSSPKILIQKNDDPKLGLRLLETQILSVKQIEEHRFEVRVKLISGFRHQIRAHMRLLGAPLVGDDVYEGVGAKRLMLHACRLRFSDRYGKVVEAVSDFEF